MTRELTEMEMCVIRGALLKVSVDINNPSSQVADRLYKELDGGRHSTKIVFSDIVELMEEGEV
jgi:hypothetical protein